MFQHKSAKIFISLICFAALSAASIWIYSFNRPSPDNNVLIKENETQNTMQTEKITESPTETTSFDETEEEIDLPKEEILHYIDAWGEWHDAVIDPSVARHSYKWDCLQREGMNISYEGDPSYSIRRGIDVSYHQGTINWNKVKAEGYEFAFIRIGFRGYGKSGSITKDKQFSENLTNAQKAGLDVGVYFFSQAINEEEAMEEARFVISQLSGIDLQLPVVYDPELIRDDTARTDNVTGEQFTRNTVVFCEAIKEAGFEPMIYSNMVWEDSVFNMKQLENYPIYYADYEPIPQTPYHFKFWQYSNEGIIDGIDAAVDLDVQFIENKVTFQS